MKKGSVFLAAALILAGVLFISSCGNGPTSPGPNSTPGPANTSTSTATFTFSYTPCMNSSQTPCTSTPTPTATNSPTITPTSTPSNTPTVTPTSTPTNSPTTTPTKTPTRTPTNSPTLTNSFTFTPTGSATPTPTGSATSIPTSTVTSCPWTPAVPYTTTPTFTPITTPSGNFILGYVIHEVFITAGLTQVSNLGEVMLSVNNSPVNNAAVTLSGPFGSAPATFLTNIPTLGYTLALYLTNTPLTVQPGQSYTLTVVTTAGTSTATGTVPGNITQAADGSSTSWTIPGNYDQVAVWDTFNNETFNDGPSPSAVSPISIPAGTYPHCGAYGFQTVISNRGSFTNASAASYSAFIDEYINDTIYK